MNQSSPFRLWTAFLVCSVSSSFAAARAQSTTRVSVDSAGAQVNGDCDGYAISADGRYVAFQSYALHLVLGDTNARQDVFRHDTLTGETIRVSVDSSGAQGNEDSVGAVISGDGRYVAFVSYASNLVPGDANGTLDVLVHDCVSGTTTCASVDAAGAPGNAGSYHGISISADGRFVAFGSDASNLVPGDTNAASDVFVRDFASGTTARVSLSSTGLQGVDSSENPALSGDGRYVAFESYANNLVPGDTNGADDVFLRDRQTGLTSRLSVNGAGAQGNDHSKYPSISVDGRCVAFTSAASNLVPGDTNNAYDVFVRELTGTITRVSLNSDGTQGGLGSSQFNPPTLSADGRFVAFGSMAPNLVSGDSNGWMDVFVHDRQTRVTTRVSVDSTGLEANSGSNGGVVSADGRYVALVSWASNLVPGDTNATQDIFLHDRGPISAFTPFCFGDGSGSACPCANYGSPGNGCENSAGTGGGSLQGAGATSLAADTVQLSALGELPNSLSIFLQGDVVLAPTSFGDGLRCAGGALKRLFVKSASAGTVSAPGAGDPAISAQSAILGDPIPLGAVRVYQVYFRDANLSFCPAGFNVTNALAIAWGA